MTKKELHEYIRNTLTAQRMNTEDILEYWQGKDTTKAKKERIRKRDPKFIKRALI